MGLTKRVMTVRGCRAREALTGHRVVSTVYAAGAQITHPDPDAPGEVLPSVIRLSSAQDYAA